MSLARSFLASGAKQVIASIWAIEDKVAAEFANRFYRHYYSNGRKAESAMQAVQIEMMNDRRWHLPFYWGHLFYMVASNTLRSNIILIIILT